MRFSQVLLRYTKSIGVHAGPKAPFKANGTTFDELFVKPKERRKAWDGQDKDAFFRDKYAHVHAKQKKNRAEEQKKSKHKLATTITPIQTTARHQDLELEYLSTDEEFIFGRNATRHVLQHRKVAKLYTGLKNISEMDPQIRQLCMDKDVPISFQTSTQEMNILSKFGVHNNYVCRAEKLQLPSITTLAEGPGKVGLYLDQITDPHNIGAILRTAKWYECDVVAYSPRNSSGITPSVVKASSGATECLNLVKVNNPLKFFESLKTQGWSIISTIAPNHHTNLPHIDPQDLASCKLNGPIMLVLGNEGEGVRTSLQQRSTHTTSLTSTQQDISSLNVSVAAAILLDKLN